MGPSYSSAECRQALVKANLKFRQSANIGRDTAGLIAQEQVVGWFQDAMEFGPRALGNRSILADPRKAEMKDILNSKVNTQRVVPAVCLRLSWRNALPNILKMV